MLTIVMLLAIVPQSFAAFQDCGATADASTRTTQSNAPRVTSSSAASQAQNNDAVNEVVIVKIEDDNNGSSNPGDGVTQVVRPNLSPIVIGDVSFGFGRRLARDDTFVLFGSPVIANSAVNDSEFIAQRTEQENGAVAVPISSIDVGPLRQASNSAASNGATEGGSCDFAQEQQTGATGDINVEAGSGSTTGGPADGGDSDGDVTTSMATGGNGGGGGAAGGSGYYAGAVVGKHNGGGGGGDGGPGGPAVCTNCYITVENNNTGGNAEAGDAQSDVAVDAESGKSGSNEFDAGSSGDSTTRDDSGNNVNNNGTTRSSAGPNSTNR